MPEKRSATIGDRLDVSVNPKTGKMIVSILRGGAAIGSVQMDTKRASELAGMILAAASQAHAKSGKPFPYASKEDEVELTAIVPTGHNVAPGRKPTSATVVFYFGETTLGVELPDKDAQILGQRLMTAAASGSHQ